jgi:hypothetical protein
MTLYGWILGLVTAVSALLYLFFGPDPENKCRLIRRGFRVVLCIVVPLLLIMTIRSLMMR